MRPVSWHCHDNKRAKDILCQRENLGALTPSRVTDSAREVLAAGTAMQVHAAMSRISAGESFKSKDIDVGDVF